MEELMKIEGLDDAIVGVASRGGGEDFLVYSRDLCLEILMKNHSWSYEDAQDYFEHNILSTWVGETTPAIMEEWTDFT